MVTAGVRCSVRGNQSSMGLHSFRPLIVWDSCAKLVKLGPRRRSSRSSTAACMGDVWSVLKLLSVISRKYGTY